MTLLIQNDPTTGPNSQFATSPQGTPCTAIEKYYSSSIEADLASIPHTRPLDHTMFTALDPYVADKLRGSAIVEAIAGSWHIEIHGIYPTHLVEVMYEKGYRNIRPIEPGHRSMTKVWNVVRPVFFQGERPDGNQVLGVAVTPGKDYVLHYASMVRHFAATMSTYAASRISATYYPDAEQGLWEWTALDSAFIVAGDTVILGYVDEIYKSWSAPRSTSVNNSFYGARRIVTSLGKAVTLLGSTFSYWGSISRCIIERLMVLGAREIIYVGKLGALTQPSDLYGRNLSPSSFHILDYDKLRESVYPTPPNRFLEHFPILDTGGHVSVPTVLEEDYRQRELASELQARSIDNEISQMASAVASFNRSAPTPVSYTALHFATDYLRTPDERTVVTPHDLARGRDSNVAHVKTKMIQQIAQNVLGPYLGVTSS